MLNRLQLNVPGAARTQTPKSHPKTAAPAEGGRGNAGAARNSKVLRFARSERLVHWSLAGPFLVSFVTGAILMAVYNPDPTRPFRSVFAGLHRMSGIALIVLPMLAALKSRGDARLHFYNIRQAWTWVYDDFKWLALMGLAAVSSRIKLPEQGKFNAAEKLNFMVLMTTYPLYVATGLLMWVTHLAVLSWILHFLMAVLAAPLLVGHLYMALVNRSTRPGLEGMVSGFVDRHWARHHYGRWYREHHEAAEELVPAGTGGEPETAVGPRTAYEQAPRLPLGQPPWALPLSFLRAVAGPGPCLDPLPVDGGAGESRHHGRFLDAQAAQEPLLHDPSRARIEKSE